MSFFTASTKEEDVKSAQSAYMNGSGYFLVKLLAPIVSVSRNGSTSVDFYVEHEGQAQVIYGNLRTTNNDGTPNKIGSRLFNQLLVISGIESVADPVEMELPIGKKEAPKNVDVLEDLMDVEIGMRIQMGYSVYKGAIQERRSIRSFFRLEDNASAEEVLSGENIGKAFERDMKYVDNVSYEDGLTAENIVAWIANNREGLGGVSGEKAKAPSFGTKRFGKSAG